MNKPALLQTILAEMNRALAIANRATQRAIESATDEETIAEHKYDTLALEASYLAHGQAVRAQKYEGEINLMNALSLPQDSDEVRHGTLVTVVDGDNKIQHFFTAPCAGGLTVQFGGMEIMVVTFDSPIGQSLKGKRVGDEVVYCVSSKEYWYDIEAII
ncbi:GreA/GreB family elongation factor [Vibrio ostreicida]|uniref:GreA/GreB family elongation factor n=1 Tax=Vibrio ostreicida TaxID=526588 RepID=A0ABT8BPZ1_9VIBR|nr:GreA/GreB family elongation factor [Vibrio ostreicida]MDN3609221.1 GreA/GreB family elongation factor [Vibrio ostreicida]NPD08113.1 transcription elongation factor [Vibrio ostreicida]